MKKLLFIALIILQCSCTKQEDYNIEKHELTLSCVLEKTQKVQMYDITSNNIILIDYSYDLFQMSFLKMCQIKGHPTFTFWFSNNQYYRL